MEDPSITLDVSILGREYRVACRESEREELLQAVQFVDRRMREIRDSGKITGTERIAVMAGLNIAHELLRSKSGRVNGTEGTERTAAPAAGFDTAGIQRRISAMQSAIDRAMAEQDKLF
jgi:cell division protein ZapA